MADVTDGPDSEGEKPAQPSSGGALMPDVAGLLKQNLRRAFEDLAEEEIPQRFLDLLEQLRADALDNLTD